MSQQMHLAIAVILFSITMNIGFILLPGLFKNMCSTHTWLKKLYAKVKEWLDI